MSLGSLRLHTKHLTKTELCDRQFLKWSEIGPKHWRNYCRRAPGFSRASHVSFVPPYYALHRPVRGPRIFGRNIQSGMRPYRPARPPRGGRRGVPVTLASPASSHGAPAVARWCCQCHTSRHARRYDAGRSLSPIATSPLQAARVAPSESSACGNQSCSASRRDSSSLPALVSGEWIIPQGESNAG